VEWFFIRSEWLGLYQPSIFLLFVAISPRKMARISTTIRAIRKTILIFEKLKKWTK
jgi:hypothetical protein